jgi:hypothetical protein
MKKETDPVTHSVTYKNENVSLVWIPVDTDESMYNLDRVIIKFLINDGQSTLVIPLTNLYLHTKQNLSLISNKIVKSLASIVLIGYFIKSDLKGLVTIVKQILDQMSQEIEGGE